MMDKATRMKLQQADNEFIDFVLKICFRSQRKFNERVVEDNMPSIPLYNCQASIVIDDKNGILWLRSYKTVIACFDCNYNVFYDFLRREYGYTKTSAQHVTKFKRYIKTDVHMEIETDLRYYPV